MTVRCKTGGQPIILQKIVKPRKASTQARTPLRKKRAKTINKIRLNISGNTEEDAAKQQSTELKSAPKARKRLVLKEAKCGPMSVTAKQGAAIRVGLGLSETKHRVQRRYFRWLGVHFASERKEKKEQLKAQGAEIEGQMRTLEVWNDTEKNMDLTPTPCAGIKDIPSYVTRLLDEYDSQGRLTWHDGSIPEDEIWIKIGGDHGGKSFKMMLQVANLANANSKHNTCMFTIVECKDTPENLRRLLVPYKDQLSELETMQWKEKRTRVFVFGDYDFLTKLNKVSDPTEPCEAWNNSFRQLVGHHHPGVWTTIECLRMDQALAATKLTQAERGEPPRKKQKRGIQQSQIRLRTLCQEFAAGTRPLELFLEAVARNIRLM
ncbi:hypothetical protein ACOMHN_048829 [Nucella lapillus]